MAPLVKMVLCMIVVILKRKKRVSQLKFPTIKQLLMHNRKATIRRQTGLKSTRLTTPHKSRKASRTVILIRKRRQILRHCGWRFSS